MLYDFHIKKTRGLFLALEILTDDLRSCNHFCKKSHNEESRTHPEAGRQKAQSVENERKRLDLSDRRKRKHVLPLAVRAQQTVLAKFPETRSLGLVISLRDYQIEAVQGVRMAFRNGKKAPLLVAPTGAGKTVIFSHIAKAAADKGNRIFIIAHRAELLRQISEKLTQFSVQHGVIAAGIRPNPFSQVQVCSVQTLVKRLESTQKPDLIILDEAHHAAAGSWAKILQRFPDAKCLGVTATPERLDGKGLREVFDTIVSGPEVASLIERSFLTKPLYFAPPVQFDSASMRTTAGDYNKADMGKALDKPHILGDAVGHYKRICPGAPAVAFCVNLSHAHHTAKAFEDAGYTFKVIDGTQTPEQRKELVEQLGSGKIHGLASCDLISEGFDLPVVTTAILLRPTKSLSLHLQQIGRVLRLAPNKPNAIILDHVGNLMRHGLAEEAREWSLEGRTSKNRNASEGPTTRQCPQCFCVHERGPVCPQCHWRYEQTGTPRFIEQVEGELAQIDPKEFQKQRITEQAEARSLDELVALAKRRGYKCPHGWARYVFQSRQRKAGKGNSIRNNDPALAGSAH